MWVFFLCSEQDWNFGARRVVREACGGSQLCERLHRVELVRCRLIVGADCQKEREEGRKYFVSVGRYVSKFCFEKAIGRRDISPLENSHPPSDGISHVCGIGCGETSARSL